MIEADELWSFVGSKGDVHWVWVALDAGTRRVLAMVVGDRSAATARRLWGALPRGYRTGATVYTDFLASYRVVIPRARHRAVGKDTGLTAHIERFGLTLTASAHSQVSGADLRVRLCRATSWSLGAHGLCASCSREGSGPRLEYGVWGPSG